MSPPPFAEQQLQNQALDKVIEHWGKAFGCLFESQHPHWKRVQNAMLCFKGMPIDHLPLKLVRRFQRTFASMNAILARYPIETWDDYQKISPDDLTKLEILILNMPPKGRRVTEGIQVR